MLQFHGICGCKLCKPGGAAILVHHHPIFPGMPDFLNSQSLAVRRHLRTGRLCGNRHGRCYRQPVVPASTQERGIPPSGPLRKGLTPFPESHLKLPQRSRKDPHPFGFLSFFDAERAVLPDVRWHDLLDGRTSGESVGGSFLPIPEDGPRGFGDRSRRACSRVCHWSAAAIRSASITRVHFSAEETSWRTSQFKLARTDRSSSPVR